MNQKSEKYLINVRISKSLRMEIHGKHLPIPHVLVAQKIRKPSNFLEAKKLLYPASTSAPPLIENGQSPLMMFIKLVPSVKRNGFIKVGFVI